MAPAPNTAMLIEILNEVLPKLGATYYPLGAALRPSGYQPVGFCITNITADGVGVTVRMELRCLPLARPRSQQRPE